MVISKSYIKSRKDFSIFLLIIHSWTVRIIIYLVRQSWVHSSCITENNNEKKSQYFPGVTAAICELAQARDS